jgi:hypothetical protein
MKKNWLAVILMLFAVVSISILATVIVDKTEKQKQHRNATTLKEKTFYGQDGKPDGSFLETMPKQVTDDYVFYEDRVVERFHYDENNVRTGVEVLASTIAALPEGITKYLMIIPTRIILEGDAYQLYADDMGKAIEEVYAEMPADVVTVDVTGALHDHQEEYLFFRTDDVWTAIGAYYAAQEFATKAGINLIGIKEYREHRLSSYLGTMRILPGAESLKEYPDYISYYFLKGATNEQTITARRTEGEYLTYKSPVVAVSRRGYDTFVGAYFSHSILHGDGKNGKTLMILGDQYSKAFAPWLTPYYENVCLVSPEYFDGGSQEFQQLLSQISVTELLVLVNAQNIGDNFFNSRIKEICTP